MLVDSVGQGKWNNTTIRVPSGDGTLFVSIVEGEDGKPCAIMITIGKAGSSVRAWAHTFARILTMALEKGATVEDIITELSSQRGDRSTPSIGGQRVTSGPEAVYVALMEYRRGKFAVTRKQLGIADDDTGAGKRGARLGRMAR